MSSRSIDSVGGAHYFQPMKLKYLIGALVMSLAACEGGADTGSTCPPGGAAAPTYATFGQAFFANYCTECHSASSPNRHGAPSDQNYDSEADIVAHATDIELQAAAGPLAINTSMPEGGRGGKPSDDERKQLGEYLACLQQ